MIRKLKIAMISGHACVRVQKMALPLIWKGHDVHLIAKAMPSGYQHYQTLSFAEGVNHYIEAIKQYARFVDVFHCHNEPSWFVTAVKEHCDVPVVLDVHDSYLARVTEEQLQAEREKGADLHRHYSEERNNFQMADALVFPSKPFGDLIMKEYALNQPSLVLPSYVSRADYQYRGGPWLGGLAYEGKVNLTKEIKTGGKNYGFKYCDYEELARQALRAGMDLHLYATRKDDSFMKAFKETAFIHEGRLFHKLLESLTRHDWGLVGNVFYTPEWDVAFPNKLFEYIAASVPVVAINAKYCSEFIQEHGVGIVVDSIEELAGRWGEHRQCRENLVKVRQKFTMEKHIGKLEELYEGLL